MEKRMRSFVEHWRPEWRGVAGAAPPAADFLAFLAEADLFL
jgi:hypothetical protein